MAKERHEITPFSSLGSSALLIESYFRGYMSDERKPKCSRQMCEVPAYICTTIIEVVMQLTITKFSLICIYRDT